MARWRLSRPFQRVRRIPRGRPEIPPSVEARIQLIEAIVTAELHDRSRVDREWVEARLLASEAMLAAAGRDATLPPVLEAVEARLAALRGEVEAMLAVAGRPAAYQPVLEAVEVRAATLLGEMEAMLAAAGRPAAHQPVLEVVEARAATLLGEVSAMLDRRLRELLEAGEHREQDRTALVKASVAEAMTHLMQSTEARAQTVLLEAKCHSDEAGQTLVSGLRAQGRILSDQVKLLAALRQELTGVPARLEAHSANLDATLQAEQAKLAGDLHGLRQDVAGAVADASAHAAQLDAGIRDDYNQQLRNVEGRLEFVRREILYELQASLLKLGQQATAPEQFQPKVVSPDKVRDQLSKGIKLNIGCGHIPLEGHINVDRRDLPGVDIVAEATAIPLDPGTASEIIASHLVEHFSLRVLEDVVFPHWHSLLAPGGRLVLVAPDGAAMVSAVADGGMTFEAFREVLFGAQEYEGDFHFNLLTTDSMTASLERSGFDHVTVEYAARRNGLCYEFRISASRAPSL